MLTVRVRLIVLMKPGKLQNHTGQIKTLPLLGDPFIDLCSQINPAPKIGTNFLESKDNHRGISQIWVAIELKL